MFLQNAARTYGTIVGEFLPTVLWVYPTHGTVGVYGIHPQYTPTEVRIPSVYTVYTLDIPYIQRVYGIHAGYPIYTYGILSYTTWHAYMAYAGWHAIRIYYPYSPHIMDNM